MALKLAGRWVSATIELRRAMGAIHLPRYLSHLLRYRTLAGHNQVPLLDTYPCLTDWVAHTPFDAHYFYQAAWAASRLVRRCPTLHVDIGSSVSMIGIMSGIMPIVFVDYRPLRAKVENLHSLAGDLNYLPFRAKSLPSLSCLHVIEHVGLGRYNDRLDPDGSTKASAELERVLAAGGVLLLSTPVGRERTCFNAHRVFAPETVLTMFKRLELVSFAFVDDAGNYHPTAAPSQAAESEYACGMFEFTRK